MTASATARRRTSPYYRTTAFVYRALRWVLARLVRLLYRYHATGAENVPAEGPVILAVNHLHLFDPAVVSTAISRKIITLAAGKWRDNVLITSFLRMAGVVFVNRGEVDRRALRACIELLGAGNALAIAPEGTRTKTGGLQRAKPGIAYIAQHTGAVIVPVAHWGVERIREWRPFRRPECHVVVGEPFRLAVVHGRLTTDDLQAMADQVMVRIGEHLPEEYRGIYRQQVQDRLAARTLSHEGRA